MPTKSILIVEDDLGLREVIELVLVEETRHKIFVAPDGETALLLLQADDPDLFLLDYWLPGMNGLELVDRIRRIKEYEHTPIVLMSAGHPWTRDLGDIHFIAKPFDLDIFLQTIEDVIS